ncbi:unnamed protein product [Lymnaea stagnalis]|uniref:LITAF domain-containing protein n=1 Tax=Lymnaea stagnalis TaxID=6523 RepID=A0AAV2HC96_LYMST
MSSASPPPPYPGYPEASGQNPYPPPNPAYPPDPYDPAKAPQGYPTAPGYLPGCPMSPAYPPAVPPQHQQVYAWAGYNQPGQPAGGYAQPTGGYAQPYGMQTNYTHGTTVVMAQPAMTVIQTFRDVPVHTNCPHCRAEVVTGTHYEAGTFTWLFCCVLWFVGCGLGCCFIPFCVDGCKDVIHTCPNCRQQIARFSRL